jgi:aspartyl-tRNA(Asn)/glutamyl-tRNA(Gln) amidotransferase subunit B
MTATLTDSPTKVLIGMEVHVQLATQSKMFTGAANGFGGSPNSQVDAVILGLPGVLPVINKRAVEMAMIVGLALNCEIAPYTKWDRKSYYYPDLPKNYQISQYDLPLCGPGYLDLPLSDGSTKRIRIRRAHLEEDAGKLLHEGSDDFSLVDLNRAGTPLLEIVTEPDLATPEEARLFGEELRRICRYLGVTQGIMQQGHMRFEPNINLHITHDGKIFKTPITECKNLNSFRAVEGSCAYEIERQFAEWETNGRTQGRMTKSTRGWDDVKRQTTLQREKEEAEDYRYFPDPDLVPLEVEPAWVERLKQGAIALPIERRTRYIEKFGATAKQAMFLVEERSVAELFESAIEKGGAPKRVLSLFERGSAALKEMDERDDLRAPIISDLPVTATHYAELATLMETGAVSATSGFTIFDALVKDASLSPKELADKLGLVQVRDSGATEKWVDEAIAANPKAVEDYKTNPKKKQASLGFLRGAVMKGSQGKADPKMVGELLEKKLESLAQ